MTLTIHIECSVIALINQKFTNTKGRFNSENAENTQQIKATYEGEIEFGFHQNKTSEIIHVMYLRLELRHC